MFAKMIFKECNHTIVEESGSAWWKLKLQQREISRDSREETYLIIIKLFAKLYSTKLRNNERRFSVFYSRTNFFRCFKDFTPLETFPLRGILTNNYLSIFLIDQTFTEINSSHEYDITVSILRLRISRSV